MGDDFHGFLAWASEFVEQASWFVGWASLPVFYIFEAGKMPTPLISLGKMPTPLISLGKMPTPLIFIP